MTALIPAVLFLFPQKLPEETKPVKPEPVLAEPAVVPQPEPPAPKWTKDDVQAMAQTLAGECYSDMEQDKRLVCEVILNRVSDDRFENTVMGVLTTPHAFNGYWRQSRPVTENDIAIAEQALSDWYANDCQPFSDLRFFCSGEGRSNKFY